MSEKMLHFVLNAPVEPGDVIGILQLQARAKEASELIIKREQEIAALKAVVDAPGWQLFVDVVDKGESDLAKENLMVSISRQSLVEIAKKYRDLKAEIERKNESIKYASNMIVCAVASLKDKKIRRANQQLNSGLSALQQALSSEEVE